MKFQKTGPDHECVFDQDHYCAECNRFVPCVTHPDIYYYGGDCPICFPLKAPTSETLRTLAASNGIVCNKVITVEDFEPYSAIGLDFVDHLDPEAVTLAETTKNLYSAPSAIPMPIGKEYTKIAMDQAAAALEFTQKHLEEAGRPNFLEQIKKYAEKVRERAVQVEKLRELTKALEADKKYEV